MSTCKACGRGRMGWVSRDHDTIPSDVAVEHRRYVYGRSAMLCDDCANALDDLVWGSYAWRGHLEACALRDNGYISAAASTIEFGRDLRTLFDDWIAARRRQADSASKQEPPR